MTAMFDWNDEELKNVIWGEASESDDHIVPYPDGSEAKPPCLFGDRIKKERNHEAANVKPSEQKKPVARTDFNAGKQERNSQYDTNERRPTKGFSMDSWPELSLSNAAKTDQESMVTELSNNLVEVSEYDSWRGDEVARLDGGSEVYPQQGEDREESDFVDYDWANIGSFDDLDRIFSKDDPMFGHVSLCNADEIWSPSKHMTSSPESIHLSIESPSLRLGALGSTSELFEAKSEYMLDQDQPLNTGYENVSDFSSHTPKMLPESMEQIGESGGKSNLLVKDKTGMDIRMTPPLNPHLDAGTVSAPNDFADKLFPCVQVNRQRRLSKGRKKLEEKREGRQLQDLCFTWSPSGNQFQKSDSQYAPHMGAPSPVPGQKRHLQGPESLQYKHFSNPLRSSMYGNMGNQYSGMPLLPQFFSSASKHKELPSVYEVPHGNSNSLNKSPAAIVKPPTMTPQEKIEKLRRRQQMRAMLAIQKQQQQFNHQDSCTEHSISHKCSHDTQMIEVEENLSTLLSLEPNSPIEHDDSSTVCKAIDYSSVEETILCRLQDSIAKLDIRMRLCIRDSLFRLAQSAVQRQYNTSDTSSINKSNRDFEVQTKEETSSHDRFGRLHDVETDTNPIDRIVAHLLFHRPLELSGKLPETPDSTKFPFERKSTGFRPERCTSNQTLSQKGLKIPCIAEGDQSKTSSCVDTSENASNTEAADGGAREVLISQ